MALETEAETDFRAASPSPLMSKPFREAHRVQRGTAQCHTRNRLSPAHERRQPRWTSWTYSLLPVPKDMVSFLRTPKLPDITWNEGSGAAIQLQDWSTWYRILSHSQHRPHSDHLLGSQTDWIQVVPLFSWSALSGTKVKHLQMMWWVETVVKEQRKLFSPRDLFLDGPGLLL